MKTTLLIQRNFSVAGVLVIFLLCIITAHAQNTWDKMASFDGGQRERAVAFSIGSRGYVGTGVDTANQVKKDFWEYDPGTDSWTQKADFAGQARRDAVGFAIGNRGYIGTGLNNAVSYLGTKQKDFYEYNPVNNTWTAKANYPGNSNHGIYYACAFATSTKGYICCGKKGASSYSQELWEWNQSTNTWTQRPTFPGGVRYGTAAFAIGDNGYVGCGADENIYREDFYQFNTTTNLWKQEADFGGSDRFNAVGFSIGEHGFISLGTDGGYQKDLWQYTPTTDSWLQKADLPASERRSAIAFVVNGFAYVGLGKGLTGTKRTIYRYTPGGPEPHEKINLMEVNRFISASTEKLPEALSSHTFLHVKSTLIVFDISGKEVIVAHDTDVATLSYQQKSLPPGIYFYDQVNIDEDDRAMHETGKFIVQ